MRTPLWTRRPWRRTAASYAAVLRAAAAIAETDPEHFSLEAIADRLGVPTDAVRAWTPDTASLVVRLHAQWHERLIMELDPIYEHELPGDRRLAAMLEARRDLMHRTPGQQRLFSHYATALEGEEREHSRRLARLLHTNLVSAAPDPWGDRLRDALFDHERIATG